MTIQVEPFKLEEIPEIIQIEETKLIEMAEGRTPRWQKGHIRAECNSAREKKPNKEEEAEEQPTPESTR